MAWINPIYDRSYQDILNLNPKAYYNAADFNRIEGNCEILSNLLGVSIQVKTNWNMVDYPTHSEVKRIVDNVSLLRNAYYVYTNCPQNPQMPVNNINKANALERILYDLYTIYDLNKDNYYYCGEISAGEDIGVI